MTLKEDTVDVSRAFIGLSIAAVAIFGPMFAFLYAAKTFAPEYAGIITVVLWCLWVFTLFEYAMRP